MPKQVDHDARREELVAAAIKLISKNKTAEVSLNDVAKQAGWSRGALNHYVDSKDDLVAMLFSHYTNLSRPRHQKILQRHKGLDAFRHILYESLATDIDRLTGWIVWFRFCEGIKGNPVIEKHVQTRNELLRKFYTELLEAAKRLGDIPADIDTQQMAAGAAILIDGIGAHIYLYKEALSKRERERLIDNWVEGMLLGKYPRKTGRSYNETRSKQEREHLINSWVEGMPETRSRKSGGQKR
jgi:AcrR family transcriptional regulator